MSSGDPFAEAQRQLAVCNACRYCAGYCPVWPELELRAAPGPADLTYLANLCHDCQDCFTACMYTAPHEYGLNPPRVFADLRADTGRRYVWPRSGFAGTGPAGAGRWRPAAVAVAVAGVALVLGALSYASTGRALPARHHPGSPYEILPYPLMLTVVALPAAWSAGVLVLAALRYWRDIHGRAGDLARPGLWAAALARAVTLRHMRGGGAGCDYPADAPSPLRRWFHLILVCGLGLCTVSTLAAAVEQDLLAVAPPYPYLSVPVAAGTLGGLGMLAGGAGLLAQKSRSDAARTTGAMRRADLAFVWALLTLAATGLLTLALRAGALFGPVLDVHLAAVVVAFAVMPYTKFTHAIFRLLAIYKNGLDAAGGAAGSR